MLECGLKRVQFLRRSQTFHGHDRGAVRLHGEGQAMSVLMRAAKLANDTVMVASVKPLIVDATKFGLDDGIEKLREIAGLPSISTAVPVSFVMTFVDE